MSLTYLILVWLRPEVVEFVGHRLAQLLQKRWLGKLHSLTCDRRAQKVMAIIIYYSLAVLLYFSLPKIGSLCIPHGVFSINRVIRSVYTGDTG